MKFSICLVFSMVSGALVGCLDDGFGAGGEGLGDRSGALVHRAIEAVTTGATEADPEDDTLFDPEDDLLPPPKPVGNTREPSLKCG